jgi:hypothetical protein
MNISFKTYHGFLKLLIITLVLFSISRQNFIELSFLSYFSHVFTLLCLILFMCICIAQPVNKKFIFLFVGLMIYSLYMVLRNNLPLLNLLQTLITLKYLFVFFVMAYGLKHNKTDLLIKFTKLLLCLLFISILFVFTDYLAPNALFSLAKDGRGINGISAGSFFSSRVLYSEFLLFISILLLSFRYDLTAKRYFFLKPNLYWLALILSFILMVLTFSRKELFLLLVVYGITFLYKSKGNKRVISVITLIFISPLCLLLFWVMAGESIQGNFNEGYVRYKIFYYAYEIFQSYFPIGSGPGTYGTLLSKYYTEVYSVFNVDRAIIGWGDKVEGPIFDLFFISLIAEYGLGFIFIIYFILLPFFTGKVNLLNDSVHIRLLRFNLGIMLVVIGFLVPIMGNMIGLLLYFLLGILVSPPVATISDKNV